MKSIKFTLRVLFVQIVALLVAGILSVAQAEQWQGKVVGVADGDTITVLNDKSPVKIRLSEIDCPENGQPFSKAAKRLTSDLCFGKIVTVLPETTDRYGRTVAHVKLSDGADLGKELLYAGLAWHYKKYSTSERLAKIENEARRDRRGLWNDKKPIAPWEWRSGNRGLGAVSQTKVAVSNEYHGNQKSKIFHAPNCRYYNCKNCTVIFKSREEAIANGFRPCKICKP